MSGRRGSARAVRLLLRSPLLVLRLYRAAAASEAGEWARAAALYERVQRRGGATDRTRLGLGTAYLGLGRDAEALAQLEAIGGELASPDDESRRRLNHAIALSRLGRRDATRALLETTDRDGWSDARRRKAELLLEWARGAAAGADDGPAH